ncbi:MAG TPA: DUF1801 domain-containing protein [Polyangiaceae bacterium]|nr:DUF1801 domain-containing protein [Polyangiaceae bacterium]
MNAPKDIDAYLKSVSPDRRRALQKLRQQILGVVPKAEECISYSMPAFRLDGHVIAGFLATGKGCSYYPFSGTTLDGMASELEGFSRTKSALHFDPAQGLPLTLVRKLLKARQREFAASPRKKKAK